MSDNSEREPWDVDDASGDAAPNKKPVVVLATGDAPRVTRRIKKLLIEFVGKTGLPGFR